MKSVMVRLEQYRSKASNAECGALDYLMSHPEESSNLNIRQLAELSYSSTSTILRLCRKLGFDGFKDLQKSMLYELAVRNESNADHASRLIQHGNLREIIDKVTYRNTLSLADSSKLVDEHAVMRAVDLLEKANNVLLLGLGASQLVARDAHQKLMRLGKNCQCSEDIHSQYVFAKNASDRDAAIIISYSGSTEEMIHCAQVLRQQSTPIIAITRFDPSPLSQIATCCLHVVGMEELFGAGSRSARIPMMNMIDILYTAYVARNFDENVSRIERTLLPKLGHAEKDN